VAQNVYDRQLGLLNPEFTRQRQTLEQNLADRGIPLNSEAYDNAINRLETNQGEQRARLAQQADIYGGQEAGRLFGQAQSARGQLFSEAGTNVQQQNLARQQAIQDQMRANELANQQRQAQLNERLGLRGQQFNELASLLGGPQVQTPTFFAPSAIDVTNPYGMQQAGFNQAYNAGMNQYSSGLGGLFDLAGSLGSAYLLR
jgi:hypothetical protein